MVVVKLQTPSERKGYARADYEGPARIISLPAEKHDEYRLRTLIHELLHLACPAELNCWCSEITEDFLELVLEPSLMFYIHGTARRHRKWILHMHKLVSGEAGQTLLKRASK